MPSSGAPAETRQERPESLKDEFSDSIKKTILLSTLI